MSAESSPAASAAPAQKPKAKAKPAQVGGLPPSFKSKKPPAGRPSAADAGAREAKARGYTTSEKGA